MKRIVLAMALVFAATTATVSAGKTRQVRYVGIHPVAKAEGGGMCYIEGPHVHIYGADKLQYRDHGGHNHFVGDPVAYGYDGPKYAYKGGHPIDVDVVVGSDEEDTEFCYLDGAHYHHYAPPEGPDFKLAGNAYFYVGTPDPVFVKARPTYAGINATYKPIVYARPVVEVEPPSGWIGVRAEFVTPVVVVETPPPVVVRPRATVDVIVPVPSVHIDVGIGGHVHGGHRGRHRGHYKGKHKKWKRW